jgi:hypothetical protein
MERWVAEELKTVALGDARLNERQGLLLERFAAKPQASIPGACRGWAETLAAYRFCDNAKATGVKVLAPHRDATIERMRREPVALLLDDTTEQDYTGHEETEGLGTLDYEHRIGLLNHVTLAVTAERVPLGVTRASIWGRSEDRERDRTKRKKQPIETKESYRWVESYHDACAIAARVPRTTVVSVRDRESDIYEVYVAWEQARRGPHAEFLVRLCQDRRVTGRRVTRRLRNHIRRWKKIGERTVTFRPTEARPRGVATLAIRSGRLALVPPYRFGKRLPPVLVNAVWVRECNPPPGQKPIEWILLTSLPVDTVEQAERVVEYYTCRWEIEVFFKILKSGCMVEDLQLQTDKRLKVAIALYLIVAWRVHFLMKLGRQCPALPCTVGYEEPEWKGVWVILHRTAPPPTPPSLGAMNVMVAQLGGYLARKGDLPPGPKVMWIGLRRAKDFALAWLAFRPAHADGGLVYNP